MFDLVAEPVKQPRKFLRTPPPAPAARASVPTPAVSARNLARLDRSVAYPVLSGRYEVIIPNRGGKIFFAESLAEAAEKVASARYSDPAKAREIQAFLEGVQRMGGMMPGEYGVRIHRNNDDGTPWNAKVRATQFREAPKFAIGEFVELVDPIGHRLGGNLVRITDVMVLNDIRAGKQYGYSVASGGGGYLLTEGRLRGVTEVPGELDFDQLSA